MSATVGETRAFLARAYGIPHTDQTHYVIVADGPESGSVIVATCCDGIDEAAGMLAGAHMRVTGEPLLAPESPSIIVRREDVLWALKHLPSGGEITPGVKRRLAEAAGES